MVASRAAAATLLWMILGSCRTGGLHRRLCGKFPGKSPPPGPAELAKLSLCLLLYLTHNTPSAALPQAVEKNFEKTANLVLSLRNIPNISRSRRHPTHSWSVPCPMTTVEFICPRPQHAFYPQTRREAYLPTPRMPFAKHCRVTPSS